MEALAAQPRRAVLPAGREVEEACWCLSPPPLLATVRSFVRSIMGQRGRRQGSHGSRRLLLVSTAFLALFALATLVKTTGWRLDLGFQPAFIIVIGGLFLVVSQNAALGYPPLCWTPLCGWTTRVHVLFWIVVVTAIDAYHALITE